MNDRHKASGATFPSSFVSYEQEQDEKTTVNAAKAHSLKESRYCSSVSTPEFPEMHLFRLLDCFLDS